MVMITLARLTRFVCRSQAGADGAALHGTDHGVRAAGDRGRLHPAPPRPAHRPRPHQLYREQVQNKRLQHSVPLPEEPRRDCCQD